MMLGCGICGMTLINNKHSTFHDQMYSGDQHSYQSREDRLRDLERERQLYSASQSEVDFDPKWDVKKAYRPSTYDYVFPEAEYVPAQQRSQSRNDLDRERSQSRNRDIYEQNEPLRYVHESGNGLKGKIGIIYLTLRWP